MNKIIIVSVLLLIISACAPTQVISKMTHQQAIEAMNQDSSIVLVDVRTVEEFATGYVAGSINIPIDDIAATFESQISDKDTQLFIICRSGNRSALASEQLKKMGFTNITDIGGIINWPQPLIQP
ncbi:MAG: rhodanese-like domain-containing protein [Erysipelothrix sp.]|jgi:rhodanese-related sulfurtransferase|nr:rhodanese-like domain-containing protein [Erysipelothrix sp.]